MRGIAKSLRWRIATLAVALAVTTAVLMTASPPKAQAVCFLGFCPKDVSMEIINESKVPLFVELCPRGHSTDPGSTRNSPCRLITYSNVIGAGGQRQTFGPFDSMGFVISPSYPVGVCEKAPCPYGTQPALNRKLNVYVENPLIGKPYFRVQGIQVALTENQSVEGQVPDNISIVLQRFSDTDLNGNPVKVMKLIVRRWPA